MDTLLRASHTDLTITNYASQSSGVLHIAETWLPYSVKSRHSCSNIQEGVATADRVRPPQVGLYAVRSYALTWEGMTCLSHHGGFKHLRRRGKGETRLTLYQPLTHICVMVSP